MNKPLTVDEDTARPGDWLKCYGDIIRMNPDAWLYRMPDVRRLWDALNSSGQGENIVSSNETNTTSSEIMRQKAYG